MLYNNIGCFCLGLEFEYYYINMAKSNKKNILNNKKKQLYDQPLCVIFGKKKKKNS